MPEEYGIKDVKEAMKLVIGVVKAAQAAYADKKFDLADVGHLVPLAGDLGPAIDGAGNIPQQLGDLSEAEAKELRELVEAEMGDGAFEKVGEDILIAGVRLAAAIKKARDLDL